MEEQVKKQEVKQQLPSKLTLADFSNVLFVGTIGVEDNKAVMELLGEKFPSKHVYVMDKEIFNKNCEHYIRKHIKWRDDIAVRDYISKPENIQALSMSLINLKEAMIRANPDFDPKTTKFRIKDVVDATNMNHSQAENVLDMLFAFSTVAMDTSMKPTHYLIIESEEQRIDYIKGIIEGFKKEIVELNKVVDHLKDIVKSNKKAKSKASKGTPIETVEKAKEDGKSVDEKVFEAIESLSTEDLQKSRCPNDTDGDGDCEKCYDKEERCKEDTGKGENMEVTEGKCELKQLNEEGKCIKCSENEGICQGIFRGLHETKTEE